jgi:hypothetical protein
VIVLFYHTQPNISTPLAAHTRYPPSPTSPLWHRDVRPIAKWEFLCYLDEPFGPPPEEYLYRCSVCGEAMLVNEALIAVGIGMAKFQREYYAGFMPKVGCPRCNGYTMEYVEQEP